MMRQSTTQNSGLIGCLVGLSVSVWPGMALAVTCQVPSDRPTIQAAVDDATCTDIVLQNQIYAESVSIDRSLLLFGPAGGNAVIRGAVSVEGNSVLAMLADFSIENGCSAPGLAAMQSAEIQAEGVAVQSSAQFGCNDGQVLFSNGFE